MPMTKVLKNRLQKLIDAINDKDIREFWDEIFDRMQTREKKITNQFKTGDEIEWNNKTGVVLMPNRTTCRIRENNEAGTKWTISSCMLTKVPVIK